MGQLKSADLLGKLDPKPSLTDPETSEPKSLKAPPKKAPQAKSNEDLDSKRAAAAEVSRGKPSAYESDLREKLRHKVQLSFGAIPEFINEEFNALAAARGMNKREFLYALLREQGANIPPYDQLDGRKL